MDGSRTRTRPEKIGCMEPDQRVRRMVKVGEDWMDGTRPECEGVDGMR